jgi:hypothetical protein
MGMTERQIMADKKAFDINFLRIAALVIALVGAVGSLYFMFNAGRGQPSVLLLALFTAWVLSPFVGLFVANMISKRWAVLTRASLYGLIIVLALGSLVAYSGILSSPETKPAFVFLVVPLTSWFLMVTVILIASGISRKSIDKN